MNKVDWIGVYNVPDDVLCWYSVNIALNSNLGILHKSRKAKSVICSKE